ETRHAYADEVRLHGAQALVVHSPRAHHARREIVHHQIALGGEHPGNFDATRFGHIKSQRNLVAMQIALQPELAISQWRGILTLDLYDLRAMIRQNTSRDWTCDYPGEIQNADAFQREPGHG